MRHETLQETLARRTQPGKLFVTRPDGRLQCVACAHHCVLKDGQSGICKVRFNEQGVLRVPYGYTAGLQADPIEKKPFFHVLPGERALSFGMLGCNFHCDYCQNWISSQTLRDSAAVGVEAAIRDLRAQDLVDIALAQRCPILTSTYNEPTITAEWAADIFRLAKDRGLLTSFVSNGHLSAEAVDFLKGVLDLCKVDLKSFNDATYQKVFGGSLPAVLASIERLMKEGIWVEVVTLVVPGLNDSEEELRDMARFLRGVSRDLPWHVTAFHPDYRMEDRPPTSAPTLLKAWEIGKEAGLRFVYSGNRPGELGDTESTFCPDCQALLIQRRGFRVLKKVLGPDGCCPSCRAAIPGRWKV